MITQNDKPALAPFQQNVLLKYRIYNGMFLTLPFEHIQKSGSLLPLFAEICKYAYQEGKAPKQIVRQFFSKYMPQASDKEQIDLLFKFIQYIERQIVLFDAIEDAAFPLTHNMEGIGTLTNLKEKAESEQKLPVLQDYLRDFKVRIVLTAHPTQFYPGNVLGITTDLTRALEKDDIYEVNELLSQLGKTPIYKREKPTPYEEAMGIIWYLENVYYQVAGYILDFIKNNIFKGQNLSNEIINIGFWPGGDRDGNPFVTPQTTRDVAIKLKQTIARNYYRDIRQLRRRLTFKGVEKKLIKIEKKLYKTSIHPDAKGYISLDELQEKLQQIRTILVTEHQSLFLDKLDSFINKVHLFGYHFAKIDLRQDSRVHHKAFKAITKETPGLLPENFKDLEEDAQLEILSRLKARVSYEGLKDEQARDILQTIQVAQEIQENNGEAAINRYIISNTQTATQVMELFAMLKMGAFHDNLTMDVVPLFETIPDLEVAAEVMEKLYKTPAYRAHLSKRGNKQTIMLGFSDGTKDGGYLMANWAIFKAKEKLTVMSRKYGISVIFFDGRGGPPARGGGKTHKFYASLGPTIEDKEVQLTIQGQTISTNYGTFHSARYNLEQLISSVYFNREEHNRAMDEQDREVLDKLAAVSYETYNNFKQHPMFVPYLEEISPLKYFAKMNVGSRPVKRGKSTSLEFKDLRAIPFVGSWSMLKQNVPGFYGLGSALKYFEDQHKFDQVQKLYQNSRFFQTLIENSMMSLAKSFFELTQYMKEDKKYGAFWEMIYQEYQITRDLLLKLTGYQSLMEKDITRELSIQTRDQIVLPLLTIQQFALQKIKELSEKDKKHPLIPVYEKMIIRSLLGNINASRNSA